MKPCNLRLMNTNYLNFNSTLKRIIESGSSLGAQGNKVQVSGVSTLGNIRAIRELILKEGCTHTLEIGLAFGASALAFLSTLKEISPGDYHHSAIDPFQNTTWGGSALRVLSDEGFSDNFTLHENYSSLVLPELVQNNAHFDLIYIDGSHLNGA